MALYKSYIKELVRFLIIFVSIFSSSAIYSRETKKPTNDVLPICVGGFCILEHRISFDEIVKEYGYSVRSVTRGSNDDHSVKYCYYDVDQKIYIVFQGYTSGWNDNNVSEILVSKDNKISQCTEWYLPKKKFPSLETNERLKLGDDVSKLLSIYGAPARMGPQGEGSGASFFSYRAKGTKDFKEPYVSVNLLNNKVVGIHIVNCP